MLTSAQFCHTWAVSSQSHLQETTYLPGLRSSGMTSLSETMPRVQSPLHQPSCLLSSGGWNSVGMCVAFPPYQPWSISGQGVGKFEQSSLSGHLNSGAPSCLQTWPGGPVGPQHPPTKAMPMLSSWIRGIGLRAHVDPLGTTGHTESSTNRPLSGCSVPLFHI